MISPRTPPGTKVVCIKLPNISIMESDWSRVPNLNSLRIGAVYTIAAIEPINRLGFLAITAETGNRYLFALTCFRYLDLPRCLTDIVTCVPHRQTEDA